MFGAALVLIALGVLAEGLSAMGVGAGAMVKVLLAFGVLTAIAFLLVWAFLRKAAPRDPKP